MNCLITVDRNCNLTLNQEYENILVYIFVKEGLESQTLVRTSEEIPITFKLGEDGLYTIIKLTIPIDEIEPYYYKNGKYYHNILEVTLLELIEVNSEVSKIKKEYFYYFSICNLKKCFVKLCQNIFDLKLSRCNTRIDENAIYNRDLVWSAINVILYMAEMDYMDEAKRILDKITSCNGLCNDQTINKCGCKK